MSRAKLVSRLDDFIFLKNGYSFWRHVVPFSIAALLLLTLSIPKDNLLLQLVELLEWPPSWVWLPAGLLTLVAASVYYLTINVQVCQAYLWPDGDGRRATTTSFIYVVLCGLMAFAVLRSASSGTPTFGEVWACLLIAVLSLSGAGWPGPTSWAESIGVKTADYGKGRLVAQKLTEILRRTRHKARGNKQDVVEFLKAARGLRSNIEENLAREPEWGREKLRQASDFLGTLVNKTEERFPLDNKSAIEDFASACRCQKEHQYSDFIHPLRTLSGYWRDWQCPKVGGQK